MGWPLKGLTRRGPPRARAIGESMGTCSLPRAVAGLENLRVPTACVDGRIAEFGREHGRLERS
eukprot:2438630-Pyramimonas_sp.AAC.1